MHGPISHYEKHCLNMKINDGKQSLINIIHSQSMSSTVECHIATNKSQYENQPWATMVILGPTSHCDNNCLNV